MKVRKINQTAHGGTLEKRGVAKEVSLRQHYDLFSKEKCKKGRKELGRGLLTSGVGQLYS